MTNLVEKETSRKITWSEFENNLQTGKRLSNERGWLYKKKTKSIELTYMTWTKVWLWVAKHCDNDFTFEVLEVGDDYVKASLRVADKFGIVGLKLETFVKSNGETHKETIEQIQMRIFVKLVANLTGFGLHLWLK